MEFAQTRLCPLSIPRLPKAVAYLIFFARKVSHQCRRRRFLFDPLRGIGRIALDDFQLRRLPFTFGEYESIRPVLQEEC